MSTPLHPADQRRLRAWSAAVVILLVPAELVFAQRGGRAEGQSVEGTLEALRLGAFTVSDPLTLFRYKSQSPNYDGHIGGGALRKFKAIFDYYRRPMILEPHRSDGR